MEEAGVGRDFFLVTSGTVETGEITASVDLATADVGQQTAVHAANACNCLLMASRLPSIKRAMWPYGAYEMTDRQAASAYRHPRSGIVGIIRTSADVAPATVTADRPMVAHVTIVSSSLYTAMHFRRIESAMLR